MVIRRSVEEVFEAFIDPAITTRFWFTKSSGDLKAGRYVLWSWEKYGVSDNIYVKEIEQNKRILIEFSDKTQAEWNFLPLTGSTTFVTIMNSGFVGDGDEMVKRAIDGMGGYTIVLCGLKALLEHDIELNLVEDKAP